jgi:superfamily II DNA/RNA helicase
MLAAEYFFFGLNSTLQMVRALGNYLPVRCEPCLGGDSIRACITRLQAGVHVVVGTPGRVYDMMRRGVLQPQHLRTIILDDVDDLLNRGFQDQILDIWQMLPPGLQVGLFSATMSPAALELRNRVTFDPILISD